jgi:hypothetical protein
MGLEMQLGSISTVSVTHNYIDDPSSTCNNDQFTVTYNGESYIYSVITVGGGSVPVLNFGMLARSTTDLTFTRTCSTTTPTISVNKSVMLR